SPESDPLPSKLPDGTPNRFGAQGTDWIKLPSSLREFRQLLPPSQRPRDSPGTVADSTRLDGTPCEPATLRPHVRTRPPQVRRTPRSNCFSHPRLRPGIHLRVRAQVRQIRST